MNLKKLIGYVLAIGPTLSIFVWLASKGWQVLSVILISMLFTGLLVIVSLYGMYLVDTSNKNKK